MSKIFTSGVNSGKMSKDVAVHDFHTCVNIGGMWKDVTVHEVEWINIGGMWKDVEVHEVAGTASLGGGFFK